MTYIIASFLGWIFSRDSFSCFLIRFVYKRSWSHKKIRFKLSPQILVAEAIRQEILRSVRMGFFVQEDRSGAPKIDLIFGAPCVSRVLWVSRLARISPVLLFSLQLVTTCNLNLQFSYFHPPSAFLGNLTRRTEAASHPGLLQQPQAL